MTAAIVLLHPAVIDVSAWWGQYESIYLLTALAAAGLRAERPQRAGGGGPGACRDDQATGTAVPPPVRRLVLDARRVAGDRADRRRSAWPVIVVVWLPFVAAGGPADYLSNLAVYQNEIFPILSLQAWNIWWLVQIAAVGASYTTDQVAVLGPITLRHIGFVHHRSVVARRRRR